GAERGGGLQHVLQVPLQPAFAAGDPLRRRAAAPGIDAAQTTDQFHGAVASESDSLGQLRPSANVQVAEAASDLDVINRRERSGLARRKLRGSPVAPILGPDDELAKRIVKAAFHSRRCPARSVNQAQATSIFQRPISDELPLLP